MRRFTPHIICVCFDHVSLVTTLGTGLRRLKQASHAQSLFDSEKQQEAQHSQLYQEGNWLQLGTMLTF